MASQSAAEAPLTAAFRTRGVPLAEVTPGLYVPTRFGDAMAEQRATRQAAGIYDFSFMASFDIEGPDALAFVGRLQTRDVARLRPGALRYTLLLTDNGQVHNDASVWNLGGGRYRIVTGRPSDATLIKQRALGADVTIRRLVGAHAVPSIQGPASASILRALGATALPPFFGFAEATLAGVACTVARIGYSGELGYELFAPSREGPALWDALAAEGRRYGALECGFEAADALRIECGFVLFSRELALPVSPREVGLERLVAPSTPTGTKRHDAGEKRLVGLLPRRNTPPAAGTLAAAVITPGIGLLTSAAYSALFGRWLALGYVDAADAYPGTLVELASGGRASVARLPYYDPFKRRPRESVA